MTWLLVPIMPLIECMASIPSLGTRSSVLCKLEELVSCPWGEDTQLP